MFVDPIKILMNPSFVIVQLFNLLHQHAIIHFICGFSGFFSGLHINQPWTLNIFVFTICVLSSLQNVTSFPTCSIHKPLYTLQNQIKQPSKVKKNKILDFLKLVTFCFKSLNASFNHLKQFLIAGYILSFIFYKKNN